MRGDFTALQQAVLQLLDRARANSPGGGAVTVSTRRDGDELVVLVEDEGRHAKPSPEEAFEPFAVTDEDSASDGLSLAIAYRIAAEHGGRLEMDSGRRGGTTVALVLPRHDQPYGEGGRNEAPPSTRAEARWAAE